jgi:murein DD-endopeptidase MepM/ murein hydrolase activator NlpD
VIFGKGSFLNRFWVDGRLNIFGFHRHTLQISQRRHWFARLPVIRFVQRVQGRASWPVATDPRQAIVAQGQVAGKLPAAGKLAARLAAVRPSSAEFLVGAQIGLACLIVVLAISFRPSPAPSEASGLMPAFGPLKSAQVTAGWPAIPGLDPKLAISEQEAAGMTARTTGNYRPGADAGGGVALAVPNAEEAERIASREAQVARTAAILAAIAGQKVREGIDAVVDGVMVRSDGPERQAETTLDPETGGAGSEAEDGAVAPGPPAVQASGLPVSSRPTLVWPSSLSLGRSWESYVPVAASAGDHFWLERPMPTGTNQVPSASYHFGSTAGGRYRSHHGLDMSNPIGTPVVSASSGVVIHAGMDSPAILGPYNDFYGNTVVVRLDQRLPTSQGEQDVFVLYGHLNDVTVSGGQRVEVGDLVGGVGMTGIAIGPHLHFEVRVGQNSYLSSVNPSLWMKSFPGSGAVAVRLVSAGNRSWSGARLSLYRLENGGATWVRTIETYLDEEGLSPDPVWGENGATGDLPAGNYYIAGEINGEKVGQELMVRAGGTTFVELRTQQ